MQLAKLDRTYLFWEGAATARLVKIPRVGFAETCEDYLLLGDHRLAAAGAASVVHESLWRAHPA